MSNAVSAANKDGAVPSPNLIATVRKLCDTKLRDTEILIPILPFLPKEGRNRQVLAPRKNVNSFKESTKAKESPGMKPQRSISTYKKNVAERESSLAAKAKKTSPVPSKRLVPI